MELRQRPTLLNDRLLLPRSQGEILDGNLPSRNRRRALVPLSRGREHSNPFAALNASPMTMAVSPKTGRR